MKKNKFFIASIIFPIFCQLMLQLFYYVSHADFSFRDALYRFIGWSLLPFYTVAGLFICIMILIMSIIRIREKKISWLQFVIIIILNVLSWLHIASVYISMV